MLHSGLHESPLARLRCYRADGGALWTMDVSRVDSMHSHAVPWSGCREGQPCIGACLPAWKLPLPAASCARRGERAASVAQLGGAVTMERTGHARCGEQPWPCLRQPRLFFYFAIYYCCRDNLQSRVPPRGRPSSCRLVRARSTAGSELHFQQLSRSTFDFESATVAHQAHLAPCRWPCRSSSSSKARRTAFADVERGYTAAVVI